MKNIKNILFLIALLFLFLTGRGYAVPASPEPFEAEQPDGTKITLQMKGDEFYGWTEDKEGYTVLRDNETKEWYYAEQATDGNLRKTSYKVGKTYPGSRGLSKHIKNRNFKQEIEKQKTLMQPKESMQKAAGKIAGIMSAQPSQALAKNSSIQAAPAARTYKHLVILVAFSDKDFRVPNVKQTFEKFFNQAGYYDSGAQGSVRDFYSETSYGKLNVESVVTDVITLDKTCYYYAGSRYDNAREMVTEALSKLNQTGFSFEQFDDDGDGTIDFITILHSGGGLEAGAPQTMWSHKSSVFPNFNTWDGKRITVYNTIPELRGSNESLAQITRIGVSCHELGHAMLGLPDLYDTTGASEGVGDFCLMGGGSWNNNGASPSLLSAWCKIKSGFATATEITSNGSFTIGAASVNDTAFYKFKGDSFNQSEYFLIENRKGSGNDTYLPGTQRGILIWHIDDNISNNNNYLHYKVDLEEADGSNALARNYNRGTDNHYFRAGNKTEFTDTSNPNSKSYSGYPSKNISQISAAGTTMSFIVGDGTQHSVTSMTPVSSKFGRTVAVSVFGSHLVENSSVKLTKDFSVINASSVTFISAGQIDAIFNIPTGAATGGWDIVLTSSTGYGGSIKKEAAFTVLENISVTAVNKNAAIKGSPVTLELTGTQFADIMTAKLTRTGLEIQSSSIIVSSPNSAKCTFNIPEELADDTVFNLVLTSSEGDSVTRISAVTAYPAPAITSFSPAETPVPNTVVMTVNGANFISGYTAFKLKKRNSTQVIIPTVYYMTRTTANMFFTVTDNDAGKWQIYVISGANEQEYVNEALFSINSNNNANFTDIDQDNEITSKIRAANGSENDASVFIPANTFSEPLNISVYQETGLVIPGEDEGFTPTNIGLTIDSEGIQPSKAITIKIPYTSSDINTIQEEHLTIARFDEITQKWIRIESWLDKQNKLICANTDHLSTFAILGIVQPYEPPDPPVTTEGFKYYPNPIKPSKGSGYDKMNFTGLSSGSTIKIYTILGQLVRSITAGTDGKAVWDARNDSGDNVATGVYIALIQDGGSKKKIKIAVER